MGPAGGPPHPLLFDRDDVLRLGGLIFSGCPQSFGPPLNSLTSSQYMFRAVCLPPERVSRFYQRVSIDVSDVALRFIARLVHRL